MTWRLKLSPAGAHCGGYLAPSAYAAAEIRRAYGSARPAYLRTWRLRIEILVLRENRGESMETQLNRLCFRVWPVMHAAAVK